MEIRENQVYYLKSYNHYANVGIRKIVDNNIHFSVIHEKHQTMSPVVNVLSEKDFVLSYELSEYMYILNE